jgi:hypothetical protein
MSRQISVPLNFSEAILKKAVLAEANLSRVTLIQNCSGRISNRGVTAKCVRKFWEDQNGQLIAARSFQETWCPLVDSNY